MRFDPTGQRMTRTNFGFGVFPDLASLLRATESGWRGKESRRPVAINY
jgi:hypothetical protein